MAIERVTAPPWGPDDEAYREHMARYKFALRYAAGKTVLDVACGTGFGSFLMANAAGQVRGLDISDQAVSFAKERYVKANLSFITGRAEKLPFPDESFDVVTSFETIEHLKDQAAFVGETKRVLKENGLLVVSTPDKKVIPKFFRNPGRYKNPFHVRELSKDEFAGLLSDFFGQIKLFGQTAYHGRAAVLLKKIKNKLFGDDYKDAEKIFELGGRPAKYLIAVCGK